MQQLDGFFPFAQHGVKIDDVVAGLVAVGVLADKAGDVRRNIVPFQVGRRAEQGVQGFHQSLPAAEQILKPLYILRYQEAVLPGVSFRVVVVALVRGKGIEGFGETAVGLATTQEAGFRIPVMPIGMAAFPIGGCQGIAP